jgi:hypothetical protein
MRHPLSIVCCVAFALAACHRVEAPATTLPSGHQVRVLQVGTMFFSADKPALMVKYETKTSFDDVPALREEAKELAEQLRSTLDGSGRDSAILSANEPTGGAIISKTRGYNFIVEKQSDGTWNLKE